MFDIKTIVSHNWIGTKEDGTVVEWHQEDESAVTSKAEAVAMVQRTIDFWLLKLVGDLCRSRKISLEEAKIEATKAFRTVILDMLTKPWPRKWTMTVEDFDLDVK